jgi:hypothetical protein
MKAFRHLLMGLALALTVLGAAIDSAAATRMWGKVTFVGTYTEEPHDGGYSARPRGGRRHRA